MANQANDRREQRRLQHQDLSRSQLLDAAEEVFGRKGYHETTLKEVAELAGFSVGSVYSFFENKDDLFQQIFLRRGEQFMAGMHQVLDGDDSPVEQLHELVDFQVGFFRKNPHFGRLYLRYSSIALLAHVNEDVDALLIDRYETSMQMQTDMFRKGQADGTLRSGDPVVLGRLFSGLMATFQSVDPLVVSDDPDSHEQLSLVEFHELVDGAFRP